MVPGVARRVKRLNGRVGQPKHLVVRQRRSTLGGRRAPRSGCPSARAACARPAGWSRGGGYERHRPACQAASGARRSLRRAQACPGPGSTTATSASPIRNVLVPVSVIGDGFGASTRATSGLSRSASPLTNVPSNRRFRSPRCAPRPKIPAIAELGDRGAPSRFGSASTEQTPASPPSTRSSLAPAGDRPSPIPA